MTKRRRIWWDIVSAEKQAQQEDGKGMMHHESGNEATLGLIDNGGWRFSPRVFVLAPVPRNDPSLTPPHPLLLAQLA